MLSLSSFIAVLYILPIVAALPRTQPFEDVKREASIRATNLEVDLGYSIYRGVANSSTGVTTFKG
jgi:hypothetical protein